MDTNRLKKFARESRTKLLSQVEAKLNTLLVDKEALSPNLRSKENQINDIREQMRKLGKEQFIEKIAYTWFNRFTALRFMDANNHTFIKIVSPPEGFTLPEILSEAKSGFIDNKLNIDKERLNKILDGQIPSSNPQADVYKMLFISACNYYNSIMPFMFERIEDSTELLLPDDLLSENSVLMQVVKNMTAEDCQNVEIIGWLYQFYISEKKDEVINAKKRYKREEIPAATQLFTPHWIVKYMVENTLGRMWLEARPNSNLKEYMEFYIEPTDKDKIPPRTIASPEEITFLDPASGSAHILVYAFELFAKIYEEEGYNKTEIPKLILEKNLYGLEIDERAAALGSFALTMIAAEYHKRYLKNTLEPKIYIFEDSEDIPAFTNAKTLGSLIRISKHEHENIRVNEGELFSTKKLKDIAWVLSKKFDCVVTNPPYVNSSYMEKDTANFVKNYYKETKSDLFACFVIRAKELVKADGQIGFVTPYVWMFIKSYEYLREVVINYSTIQNLIQLEYNAFEPAVVPVCTFTLRNELTETMGDFIKLSEFRGYKNQPIKTLEAIENPKVDYRFTANQNNFKKIPGSPIAYWVSEKICDTFEKSKALKKYADPKAGMQTGENEAFIRLWYEVKFNYIGVGQTSDEAKKSNFKWFPYNKGGEFRKWYGNNEYVVNWENDGEAIKRDKLTKLDAGLCLPSNSKPKNMGYYFRESITWSFISSSSFGVRYSPTGFLFDIAGSSLFLPKNLINYFLGYLNSTLATKFLNTLNPTMNYQVGNIATLPIIVRENKEILVVIEEYVLQAFNISKAEWDSRETSWDFKKIELLSFKENNKINSAYGKYCDYWQELFVKLHKSEVKLNKLFLEIYGLQEELTPEVDLKNITILKQETTITKNNELVFNADEIFQQFISYSVGCMFGRYSLDKEGLILANQGETLEDYLKQIPTPTFIPDDDAIIPVLEDEYFTDDIVGRFREFLKVTFGEEHYEENIAFVEEAIGKDIRKYFAKDFYADHIKRYKKRPIYWMFSSPKKSFNVLIYMHSYKSDTVSKILNDYLREFQEKLKARKSHLTQISISEDSKPAEKNKALKEINKIDNIQAELQEYERDILYPLAAQKIEIDLDDGVKVNYNKFGKALQKVSGLSE